MPIRVCQAIILYKKKYIALKQKGEAKSIISASSFNGNVENFYAATWCSSRTVRLAALRIPYAGSCV